VRVIDITKSLVTRHNRHKLPTINVIYHNIKEWEEVISSGKEICNKLFSTCEDLFIYCFNNPEILVEDPNTTYSRNMWVKTGDNYIPDYFDIGTQEVVNMKDINGNNMPTDGCYIKIMILRKQFYYSITACNGTNRIPSSSKGRIPITAAIMPLVGVKMGKLSGRDYANYNEGRRLKGLLSKRVTPKEMRFTHSILNPNSPFYLNPTLALKKLLHISTKDKQESYINSKKFKELLMSEINMLFPDIKAAIRQVIPPEKVGSYIKQVIEKSLVDETSEEVRNNLQFLFETAYDYALDKQGGLIGNGIKDTIRPMNIPLISQSSNQQEVDILSQNKKEKEEMDKLKEDLDYPNGYISEVESEVEEVEDEYVDKLVD